MPRLAGVTRSRIVSASCVALAAGVLVIGLRSAGRLVPAELWLYDAALRSAAQVAPSAEPPPIALVLIGEQDIRRFGHPLSDDLLRGLIERLLASEPRAVGIDIYRDLPVPMAAAGSVDGAASEERFTEAYRALGRVVTGDPRVIMTLKFPDAGGIGTPAPGFLDSDAQVGFSDLPVDPGGVIRRGLLYLWDADRPLASLSLRLALRYLESEHLTLAASPQDPEQVMLGSVVIPAFPSTWGPYVDADDAGYQFVLDFENAAGRLPAFSLSALLDGEVDPARLRDRIVLVGTAAVSVKDSFYTPLSRGAGGDTMFGVEVHAIAADQLIRYARGQLAPISAPGRAVIAAWTLGFALLGVALGLAGRSLWLQAAGIMIVIGLQLACVRVGLGLGWWLPLLSPLLAFAISSAGVIAVLAAIERSERRELAGLFSRFQGTAVAEEIWRRRLDFIGEGGRPISRRVTLTALMSDLEGYTAASEKMDPQALMSWVNEYMNAMAQLVEQHGGVVDDYAGDGVKANFGFPIPSTSEAEIAADARRAVRCALAMGERMECLNASWRERELPTGRCRVGLFTGPAVVGCIGGDRSLKYTSVGDTVNTAARLEGFGKDDFLDESGADWRILIGQQTRRLSGDEFEIVDVGAHRLKGKDDPVPIYRVLGSAA